MNISSSSSSSGKTSSCSSSVSAEENNLHFLETLRKKEVYCSRVIKNIKLLEWKESAVQTTRRRGDYTHGDKDLQDFDKFCRLYNLLFFLREPHIQHIDKYRKRLKEHIVIQDELAIKKNNLWVCYEDYFDKWFKSKNNKKGA